MDKDLSTPEKALHALADAYRDKDMDLAATYRDFPLEARLVLQYLDKRAGAPTAQAIAELAATLQAKWREAGPPDLASVTTQVVSSEHYAECFYVVTEQLRAADGRVSSQRLFMAQSGGPWVVLCPALIYETQRQEKKPWWAVW
ncbi:hypothetical protein [Pseudomonas sp. CGJS7]|uniref:hypothetical protein n=1 Tax=Pseudomonas sp. CGJS7 TaxID=3109348 RepID=UPI00300B5405